MRFAPTARGVKPLGWRRHKRKTPAGFPTGALQFRAVSAAAESRAS
jgi:hypothetical protein